MATQAQINANRQNAQKSTGPRTDTGKSAVRGNAIRHGLCSAFPLTDNERPEEAQSLLEELREANQPADANEEILVFKMAEHFWHMKRAGALITQALSFLDLGESIDRQIALFMRYYNNSDRGFNQNLRELRKLQKERRLLENGFVSQETQPAPEAPVEEPQTPVAPPSASFERPPLPPYPNEEELEAMPFCEDPATEAKMFVKRVMGVDVDDPLKVA